MRWLRRRADEFQVTIEYKNLSRESDGKNEAYRDQSMILNTEADAIYIMRVGDIGKENWVDNPAFAVGPDTIITIIGRRV